MSIQRKLMKGVAAGASEPVIVFRDSRVAPGSTASTTTLSSVDLGVASAGRLVVVVVTKPYSRPADDITSITVGGVAMSLYAINETLSGTLGNAALAIGHMLVTSGTSADIVANFSNPSVSCQRYMAAYTVDGMENYAPVLSSGYAANVTNTLEAINLDLGNLVAIGKSFAIAIAATLSTDGGLSMTVRSDTTLNTIYGPTDIRTGEEVWVGTDVPTTEVAEVSLSLTDSDDQDGIAAILGVFTKP